MQTATPASGISRVSAPPRRLHPAGAGRPPDRRQLRHPQASESANMAGAAAPVSDSLHADLLVVVESGGTVVCTDHTAGDSPRLISKCEGIGGQDRLLRPALQPLTAAFRLECNGRFHSRQNRPALFTYFRDTTLARDEKDRKQSALIARCEEVQHEMDHAGKSKGR